MDYATLPPEINSARMYTGAGSAPMLAAAAAWDRLAAELRSAAASYSTVTSGLTTAWRGPSSATMAAAAAPYAAWLHTTADHAEQTANQARTAATAYETAFAATVPPPVIAANRATLASLSSTNVFGQNTVAIATTEAHYASMWAQDAAAMHGYAAASATASHVTPFSPPPHNTNPAGAAAQTTALTQAAATSTAANTQTTLSQLLSAVPQALHSLAAPAANPSPLTAVTGTLSSLNSSPLATVAANVELISQAILPANSALINTIFGLAIGGKALGTAAAGSGVPLALAAGLESGVPSLGSAVAASVGQAGSVGRLAVPPGWAAATPAIRTVAAVLSGAAEGVVPTAAVTQGSLVSAMAAGGIAGGALGAALPRVVAVAEGRDAAVKDRKDLKNSDSPQQLQRLVAEMAEKPDSVQHWHTDPENLDGLLAELRQKPGTHAVHVKSVAQKVTPPKAQPV
ncbi:PPE family protein [Mycobacterium sp.]|uniref:PPE family protein n=1 Tax=Mycobacterium sp. TaxID=1785 RepID=UPI0031D56628